MVVLVGLVAVVSVSLLVVGASVADSTADAAQTEQVETSMSQFADTANDVAAGDARGGEFRIGSAATDGTASADGDAGRIAIVLARNATGETTLMNSSLGVYRYQLDDGTEFAYQGGGVWRLDDDYPSMVRPPEFEYRASPAPTLTFPHVRVSGEATDSGAVAGELAVAGERTRYPVNDSLSNPIEGEYLTVEIESRYCEGWERHVDQRTDAAFDERCGSDGRLVANMTVGDLASTDDTPDGDVNGAIVGKSVETNDWNDDSSVDGDVVYDDSITSYDNDDDVDDVIEDGEVRAVADTGFPFDELDQRLDDLVQAGNDNGSWTEFDANTTYDGTSTHYLEMDGTLSEVTFDVDATQHDQTIVIRDELIFSSTNAWLDVDGTNDVRIFVDDVVEMNGNPNGDMGNPNDSANMTIVTSQDFKLTGNTNYHGVVVAPDGVARVDSSRATVDGALVGATAKIETGDVTYDAEGWTLDGSPADGADDTEPGDLYYLHVSETELDVAG